LKATTRRRFDVRVARPEDAHALLAAMHLDANEARVTFFAPSPVLVQPLWQMLFVFGWVFLQGRIGFGGGHHAGAPPFTFVPFILTFLTALSLPVRIVTGPDGFRVAWVGTGAFRSYDDVRSITHDEASVRVGLGAGGEQRIRFRGPRWANKNDLLTEWFFGSQRPALADRLRAGKGAHASRATPATLGDLLDRGGRTDDAWLAALRGLGRGDGGYRAASVSRESLWEVTENPAATPDARIAAAVALRETLDGEGRARLAALAEATAAPRLRVALAAAARPEGDVDDGELAEALAEGEAERSQRRA
jgi:hypothetical protein